MRARNGTPECLLNESQRFAFVLENSSDNQTFVCYGDNPEMELGKELAQYLHGVKVSEEKPSSQSPISPEAEKILERAKQLNDAGDHWHHHMLFPDCIYNDSKGKWAISFEDPETKETLEILSDQEPKADLEQIENLYYKQKELK